MARAEPWRSTTVRPRTGHPGRWLATIDESWVAGTVPLGGVSAAVAARAMDRELQTQHPSCHGQRLRSIHCVFALPVPAGAVEADVVVLRAGRSLSQAQVTLRAEGGDAGLTALGAFGATRPGYEFTGITPPDVPPPEESRSFRLPPPSDVDWDIGRRMPLWNTLIEGRQAIGLPPWDRSDRSTAETATWLRFDAPTLDIDGQVDPLAALVMADLMLGSVGQRIGHTEARWLGPSVDFTVHLFATPSPSWNLAHSTAQIADDGYVSLQSALWNLDDDIGPHLVALAVQQMYFVFPEGVPSPDQLKR